MTLLSTENVVGECCVPALCLVRRLAPYLVAFAYLTKEDIGDFDRPGHRLEIDGIAYRVIGGQKRKACIEQMRRALLGSGQCRRDGEGTGFSLAIGDKSRLRHVPSIGRIADDMNPGV